MNHNYRFYEFSPRRAMPFEIGAQLMSAVAFPAEAEEEAMAKAASAMCADLIRLSAESDPGTAEDLRRQYSDYWEIAPKDAHKHLRTLKRRLDERMLAARMSLGFFTEGLTRQSARLPPSMARLSLNELSKLVLDQSRESDPENVEKRVWRKSLPAIHIAAAYQVLLRLAPDDASNLCDLQNLEAHRTVVMLAEIFEDCVLKDRRFGIAPEKLIRPRWVE